MPHKNIYQQEEPNLVPQATHQHTGGVACLPRTENGTDCLHSPLAISHHDSNNF